MNIKIKKLRSIKFMTLVVLPGVCLIVLPIISISCGNTDNSNSSSNTSVEQKKEGGAVVKGYVQDLERLTVKNNDFRRVLYTAKNCQLVLMSLKPKEEIGMEVHKLDQFFRVEEGSGEAVLNNVPTAIRAGFGIIVPAGTYHNIINTGSIPMKLYTIYSPPNHRDGVIHKDRAEAVKDNEHFDGKTTEN